MTSRSALLLAGAYFLFVFFIAVDRLRPRVELAALPAERIGRSERPPGDLVSAEKAAELDRVAEAAKEGQTITQTEGSRAGGDVEETPAETDPGGVESETLPWEKEIPSYLTESNRLAHGHWLLDRYMAVPRRNHHCFLEDPNPELNLGERLTLVAGRFAPSVEVMDLDAGKPSKVVLKDEDLLGINHVGVVEAGEDEWWIPCGLEGHKVNKEVSMERVTVIKRTLTDDGGGKGYRWEAEKGPNLDVPRGACAAISLKLDGGNERPNVCVIGGSEGSHDKGFFHKIVSCYSMKAQEWRRLPDLPVGIDHGNAVLIPAGTCSPDDPARALVLSYRVENYGHAMPEIFSLDLHKADQEGGLQVPTDASWQLYYNESGIIPADAAAVTTSRDGRYLFKFGGVKHPKPGKNLDTVHAFSVCQRRWVPDITKLYVPRFAILSCDSDRGYTFVCGGESRNIQGDESRERAAERKHRKNHNYKDCEVFNIDWLTQLAAEKDAATQEGA